MKLIDVDWRPPPKQLRQFAALFLLFVGAAAALAHLKGSPQGLVWSLGIAAAVGGIGGLVFPAAVRPLYVVLMAVTLPIGLVVSTVLLTAIYFLLITPIGLLARLVGRDRIGRRPDPTATSYWQRRAPTPNASRYFRQY